MTDDDDDLNRFHAEAAASSAMNVAASAWLEHLRANNAEAVWASMDPDFRLAYAQHWIVANSPQVLADPTVRGLTPDEFAQRMADPRAGHPLWPHLARLVRRDLCGQTLANVGGPDRELGVGTRPRPIAPGLELVRLIPLDAVPQDASGMHVFRDRQTVETVTLVMREQPDGAWAVAGVGHAMLLPGWPPETRTVASPTD